MEDLIVVEIEHFHLRTFLFWLPALEAAACAIWLYMAKSAKVGGGMLYIARCVLVLFLFIVLGGALLDHVQFETIETLVSWSLLGTISVVFLARRAANQVERARDNR
jgi:hypothetical protein